MKMENTIITEQIKINTQKQENVKLGLTIIDKTFDSNIPFNNEQITKIAECIANIFIKSSTSIDIHECTFYNSDNPPSISITS